jgi:phosphatidylinositol phospholipase C, delta
MIRTLTTHIKLRDCLTTIKEYAFESSPYPVIITLEDHLNTALRAKLTSVHHLSITFNFHYKRVRN